MINIKDNYMIRKIDIICHIKKYIWNKIIDTKYGWHDYIQGEIDDIDIEQLITDRAEDHYNGMCDTYDR